MVPQIEAAVAWAIAHELEILAIGKPLSLTEIALAESVEVREPESIRVQLVAKLPMPDHPSLQSLIDQSDLRSLHGLTVGHGIYIVQDRFTPKLLSHELRHVAQYEQYGSIRGFMVEYITQVAQHGYRDAPLEIDARNHEV